MIPDERRYRKQAWAVNSVAILAAIRPRPYPTPGLSFRPSEARAGIQSSEHYHFLDSSFRGNDDFP